ncbi:hypothetical protein MASR2M15_17340 [Anaerolineales bacterium]
MGELRKRLVFMLTLLAFSASLTALLLSHQQQNQQLRAYVNPTHTAQLPYKQARFGVNAELRQYAPDELEVHFNLMEEVGVTWVRQFFDWNQIEAQKGVYDWAPYDQIIQAFQNHPDLRPIAVLVNTPGWARHPAAPSEPSAPPAKASDFADFASELATRYGDALDIYQIWDEPNLRDAWGQLNPNPTAYTALLAAAYQQIHAHDPQSTVLAAALAPTQETGPENLSDVLYLEALYQTGAEPYFDGVAGKPYGFNTDAYDREVAADHLNFSRLIALHEVMIKYQDHKPLWASNWGWNNLPPNWEGEDSIWGQVTGDERRDFTLNALHRSEREWPWLGGLILSHWQPDAPPDDPIWGFALIDQQDHPTHIWQALKNYSPPPAASNGLYHPANPYTRYSGLWTFGELGADVGWLETSDSVLEFDFVGTEISLLLREGDYVAFLYPTIDGQAANATPIDNQGNSYVFLRSADQNPHLNLVPIATHLPYGQHTLRLVVDKGWDQWALAGFAVSDGDLGQAYQNQIYAALLTLLTSTLALLYFGRQLNFTLLTHPLHRLINRLSFIWQLFIGMLASIFLTIGMLLTFGDAIPAIFRKDLNQIGFGILISGGLLAFEPAFLISLIALLILFVLFYHSPNVGILLTLFYVPFFLFPVELYKFAFPLAELLLLICFSAWLLRQAVLWARTTQSKLPQFKTADYQALWKKFNRLDQGILALFIIACISLLWVRYPNPAITEFRTFILEPVLFYLILRSIQTPKLNQQLVDTLIIASLVVSVIGLFLYFQGQAIIVAEGGSQRLASVYGSPNNVALLIGRALPFCLSFLLLKLDKVRRVYAGLSLLILGLTVLLTQSVGAILIGIPLSIIAVIYFVFGKKSLPYIILFLVIILLITLVLLQLSPRFSSLLDFTQGTNFFRLRVWESALEIISDHPLTGIGLDQFLYYYRGEYIRPDAIWDRDLSHPHNFLLDFWTRLGVLGVFVFFFIQYHFWKNASHYQSLQDPYHKALLIGSMASMINLLGHGLIDNSVFVSDLVYIFMLLVALMAYSQQTKPTNLPT